MTYKIRKEQIVCDECYGFYGPIGTYDTKPKIAFQGRPPHYFGIELEVELADQDKKTRGFKAKECVDLLGNDFCIVKDDGSLQCGFEIVTQPASIDSQKEHWNHFFANQPVNLVSFNSVDARCGLHIHCAKKPLSLLTIAKIVVFVNEENNGGFIELIAGRKPNHYFQISKKKYGIAKHAGNLQRNQRYEAVNLVNGDTIEFRIFKGTLKKESFYKALEFCDALIHFCATSNYGISHCRKVDNFIDYVGLRSKDYPNLWAFLLAKVLKKETKLTKECGFAVKATDTDIRQC